MSINTVTEATTREYIVYSPIKKFIPSVSVNEKSQPMKNSLYKFGKNMLAKYAERPRTVPASNP